MLTVPTEMSPCTRSLLFVFCHYLTLWGCGYKFTCVKERSFLRFTVKKKKKKTIQPDVFVFTWHVPPVPGVARQMVWWLQTQALARLQSDAWEGCLRLCPWCPRSHFSLLSLFAKFAGQAFWIGSFLLIQGNHLGFDYFKYLIYIH